MGGGLPGAWRPGGCSGLPSQKTEVPWTLCLVAPGWQLGEPLCDPPHLVGGGCGGARDRGRGNRNFYKEP